MKPETKSDVCEKCEICGGKIRYEIFATEFYDPMISKKCFNCCFADYVDLETEMISQKQLEKIFNAAKEASK